MAAASAPASAAAPITSQKLVKSSRSFSGDVRKLPRSRAQRPIRERPEPEAPRTVLRPQQESAPIGSGVFPGPQLPAPSPSSSVVGMFFSQDCGGVTCGDGHPPDTTGDVGPRYYVQTVNTAVG